MSLFFLLASGCVFCCYFKGPPGREGRPGPPGEPVSFTSIFAITNMHLKICM